MRRLGAHATLGRRRARQRTSRARSDRRRVTRGTTLRRNGRLGRHMRWNHSVSYSWLEPAAGASVMRGLELLACAHCGLLCTPMAACCCTVRHELSSGVQLKLDPTGGGSLCTVGQRPSGTAAKWDSGQVGQRLSGTVAKWDSGQMGWGLEQTCRDSDRDVRPRVAATGGARGNAGMAAWADCEPRALTGDRPRTILHRDD